MDTAGTNPVSQRNYFFPLALAYLVVPNLIFLATWLRPWFGLPAALIVATGAGWLIRRHGPATPRPKLSRQNLWIVLGLAFLWTLFGGVGGLFPQSPDYIKHNLLFHDLVHSPWPVNYALPGGETNYLCYGLGYYLAPALGGKWLGEGVVPGLAFAWTLAGTALFFYWVATFDRKPRATLVIFLFFAVTGVVWMFFKKCGLPGLATAAGIEPRLTNLGLLFSYNDSFTRFQFQPQHALTGWLGTALLYEMLWLEKNPTGAVFLWATGLLWSPLSCVGLLLVPLAAWPRVRWQNYFEMINLFAGGLLLVVMGIYFQGHVPLAERGPIWKFSTGGAWLVFYPAFLALELTPVLFLFLADRKCEIFPELRPLFLAGAGVLVLLPLYKIGFNSDLRLQASAPALLFAALAASRCWQSEAFSLKRPLFALLAGSVLLGAVYPVARPWANLLFNSNDCSYANIVQTSGFKNLSELRDRDFDAGALYLGRANSVAARWLLR